MHMEQAAFNLQHRVSPTLQGTPAGPGWSVLCPCDDGAD
jgi:hypothetical protein